MSEVANIINAHENTNENSNSNSAQNSDQNSADVTNENNVNVEGVVYIKQNSETEASMIVNGDNEPKEPNLPVEPKESKESNDSNDSNESKETKEPKSRTNKFWCDICEKDIGPFEPMKVHFKVNHPDFEIDSKTGEKIAKKLVEPKKQEPKVSFWCEICEKELTSVATWNVHNKFAHGIEPPNGDMKSAGVKKDTNTLDSDKINTPNDNTGASSNLQINGNETCISTEQGRNTAI